MLGRSEPVSLTPVESSGPSQDHRKDESALKFPSRKKADENVSLLKKSHTLDALKTENSFEQLTEKLIGENASLSISFNEDVENFVYTSVDKETGEVLNQWPPEDYIRQLASLLELNTDEPEEGQAIDETV